MRVCEGGRPEVRDRFARARAGNEGRRGETTPLSLRSFDSAWGIVRDFRVAAGSFVCYATFGASLAALAAARLAAMRARSLSRLACALSG